MELALVLPLVCLLLLAVVQVGLVVHAQLLVVHAAREGVRAAVVDGGPRAAELAVMAGVPLDPRRVNVSTSDLGGRRIQVEVRYRFPADVPLVGALIGEVELGATAVMRREYERE